MKQRSTALLAARFFPKTKRAATGCLIWTGAHNAKGYGKLYLGPARDRVAYAHRVAWELAHGPIPDGMMVCHHCDVPSCVEPSHLFLGTCHDNHMDMVRKGRHWMRQHPERLKLNEDDVRAIRRRRMSGEKGVDLAREYGVRTSEISRIHHRVRWAHVV